MSGGSLAMSPARGARGSTGPVLETARAVGRVLLACAIAVFSLSPGTPAPLLESSDERLPVDADARLPGGVPLEPFAGMIRVPGGRFTMGADSGGEPDERPAHEVSIGAFWLDVTEVTNADYAECAAAGLCKKPDPTNAGRHRLREQDFRGPHQPVSEVSWDDAVQYCAYRGKRLPTEAEWERAARGDDARRYPWGNDPPDKDRAVFNASRTAEVGTHPRGAGPYGHLDLGGNVWEWVADEYDPYAYRRATAGEGRPGSCPEILDALRDLKKKGQRGFTGTNPIPTECEHVLRGGGFNYPASGLRVTNRVHHPGRFRLVMSGFRCARDD